MNFIFDFDGTIANTENLYNKAIYKALGMSSFNYTYDDVTKHTLLESWETIAKLAGRKRSTVRNRMLNILVENVKNRNFLFAGAKSALNTLSKKNALFIVSNSYQKVLDTFIRYYKLQFRETVGRSKKFRSKVSAIRHLINKYKLKKSQTAYVGDSTGDIKLAKKFGFKSIAVYSGWNTKPELEKLNPDQIYPNIKSFVHFYII